MCGIAGALDTSASTPSERLEAIGRAMARPLEHRGPDDEGTWTDPAVGVVLAHRRLSILDLSPEGHQPMRSADGRYVVSYNGEIYNHEELRGELERRSHRFRGHSDTEVLLAAIVEWGLVAAVQRFNGMFAAAVWDRHDRRLYLVRDRFGEKPLYYGWSNRHFLFASELKAIAAHPHFCPEIDRGALALYARHGYVPAPHCVFRGFSKLMPGTILSVEPGGRVEAHPYWSAWDSVARAKSQPFDGDDEAAVSELHRLMLDSVRIRMVADVPLGAFLSGGIDSSTIVSLMQAQSERRVKTFTVGFGASAYDEAAHAGAVAKHLGTDHTELYVTGEDALAVVPRVAQLYDEPFADSSQIPTFLIAALARRSVVVGLSGDGGDELFGGYSRYGVADRAWRAMGWMPLLLRARLARLVRASPGVAWTVAREILALRGLEIRRRNAEALQTISDLLVAKTPAALYRTLLSQGMLAVLGAPEPLARPRDDDVPPCVERFVERMMLWDTVAYLPDDILTKVDRATMGVGLEARVPLLDHRVFELAWRLPLEVKVRNGVTKWPIRRILDRYVPKELVDRPKMGFAVPMASWLRGPLRTWAEDLLARGRLERQGLFDPEPLVTMLDEHLSGTRDRHHPLWAALVFQAWMDATADRAKTATRLR